MHEVKTRQEIAQMMDDMTKAAIKKFGQSKKAPMQNRASNAAWRKRWMPSAQYVLLTIPLDKVEQPMRPKRPDIVLKKVKKFDARPVFIDKNVSGAWPQSKTQGQRLDTVIIDGKHRVESARILGKKTIRAWVGALAIPHFVDPNAKGYWWLKGVAA